MDKDCDVVKLDWSRQAQREAAAVKEPHETFRLIRPADGERFLIDPALPANRQQILCEVRLPRELLEKAKAEQLPIRWWVDGEEAVLTPWDQSKVFLPLRIGSFHLQAAVGEARTRRVRIHVN